MFIQIYIQFCLSFTLLVSRGGGLGGWGVGGGGGGGGGRGLPKTVSLQNRKVLTCKS